jgi:hypothetical protein
VVKDARLMTHIVVKTIASVGTIAGIAAAVLALLQILGLADDAGIAPALQIPLFGLLMAVSVTMLGGACLSVMFEQAQARSVRAVNTAFNLGVTYGMKRQSGRRHALDEVA